MGKPLRKQQARLHRRLEAHQRFTDRVAKGRVEMNVGNRARTGGYHIPGSMNRHKTLAKGRRG